MPKTYCPTADMGASAVLGFYGYAVVAREDSDGVTTFTLEHYACRKARCPGCHVKQTSVRHFTDIPHEWAVKLKIKRVLLDSVGCAAQEPVELPFLDYRWGMTHRAKKWALRNCMDAPFAEVARRMGESPAKIGKLFSLVEYLLEGYQPTLQETIGLDGVHLPTKGTLTVLAGLGPDGNRVIEVFDTHNPQKLRARLLALKNREMVRWVVIDPASTLRKLIREFFPNATICCDKRHVIKKAIEAVDAVRICHGGTHDTRRSKLVEEGSSRKTLKRGTHKRRNALTDDEIDLLNSAPELVRLAYDAKERFISIYSCASKEAAEKAVDAWIASLDPRLLDAFRTLRKLVTRTWRTEFLAYFDHQAQQPTPPNGEKKFALTTAFIESANRTLKGFAADSRGQTTAPRLRAQMVFRFGSLTEADLDLALASFS